MLQKMYYLHQPCFKLSPLETIQLYQSLFEGIDIIIGKWCYFKDEELNLLHLALEFDCKEFSKSEIVRLLRANSALQSVLERLSTIIEYVPYQFRQNYINV